MSENICRDNPLLYKRLKENFIALAALKPWPIMTGAQDIFDAGYALMEYNITTDRQTYRFRDERFDFHGAQAVEAFGASEVRDGIRVCIVGKLREIAERSA